MVKPSGRLGEGVKDGYVAEYEEKDGGSGEGLEPGFRQSGQIKLYTISHRLLPSCFAPLAMD